MFSDIARAFCNRPAVMGLASECRVSGFKARCPLNQEDGAAETRRTVVKDSFQFFPTASVGIRRRKPTSPPVRYLRAALPEPTRWTPSCLGIDRLWWKGGWGESKNRICGHRLSNAAQSDRCVRSTTCSETCSISAAMLSGGVVNGAPVPLLSSICEPQDVS